MCLLGYGEENEKFIKDQSTEILEVQRLLDHERREHRDPPDDQQQGDNQQNDQ